MRRLLRWDMLLVLILGIVIALVIYSVHMKELACAEYNGLPYGDIPANCIHYVRTW